ncbi:hypothetical protein CSKR_103365, partial [Clonorchis sinensis]
ELVTMSNLLLVYNFGRNPGGCFESPSTGRNTIPVGLRDTRARWLKWLECEFTDRKVRGSNPTSASRLPLSRLGQPDSVSALVLPSGGTAARHRRGVTAERFIFFYTCMKKSTAPMG